MRSLFAPAALAAALMFISPAGPADAQTCGKSYAVRAGDTLSAIAQKAYRNNRQWSVIYYANRQTIGKDPTFIYPGQQLRIPCAEKSEAALAKADQSNQPQEAAQPAIAAGPAPSNKIRLLTADDYRPFTDRALPAGGMITDIINTALKSERTEAAGPEFEVSWVNDWSAHLNPLLVNRAFDMGFPWFQPNCERYDELDEPARFRCDKLHFSKPVFEILVLFFTRQDADFRFNTDDDVVGKRLCRPSGYFTFDLDDEGRNWVKEEKVTLLRPQSVDECFQMLDRNEVDAVVLNEFTGRAAVAKAQMGDRVRVIEKPVSLLSLHVVVAKTHPNAKAYLRHVNDALDRIRENGRYSQIVEDHLSVFWKTQGSS
jgi:polar amino acid transport system substrate-binding protein